LPFLGEWSANRKRSTNGLPGDLPEDFWPGIVLVNL
jgi:hypothetical protein